MEPPKVSININFKPGIDINIKTDLKKDILSVSGQHDVKSSGIPGLLTALRRSGTSIQSKLPCSYIKQYDNNAALEKLASVRKMYAAKNAGVVGNNTSSGSDTLLSSKLTGLPSGKPGFSKAHGAAMKEWLATNRAPHTAADHLPIISYLKKFFKR